MAVALDEAELAEARGVLAEVECARQDAEGESVLAREVCLAAFFFEYICRHAPLSATQQCSHSKARALMNASTLSQQVVR